MTEEVDRRLLSAVTRGLAERRQRGRLLTCCEAAAFRDIPAPRLHGETVDAFMRILGGFAVSWWRYDVDNAMARCESAIEQLFLLAVSVSGWRRSSELRFSVREPEPFTPPVFRIAQQFPVGRYRVDFHLSLYSVTFEEAQGTKSWRKAELLVECDGHDFHERTKAQARHDREKDRVLQAAGFRIFRFTGSELWSDPLGKADEAVELLNSAIETAPALIVEPHPARRQGRVL